MSIIRRKGDMFSGVPSIFDDFFSKALWDWNNSNFSMTGTTLPAVNILESADEFQVEMAAPGMEKKDFKIELENNILTISSERKKEDEDKEGDNFTRREFSYQSFQRTFTLPHDVVDADKINARYENGVLKLLIPKKEEAKQKPPRQIEIV